jgi:hypothetical protein
MQRIVTRAAALGRHAAAARRKMDGAGQRGGLLWKRSCSPWPTFQVHDVPDAPFSRMMIRVDRPSRSSAFLGSGGKGKEKEKEKEKEGGREKL